MKPKSLSYKLGAVRAVQAAMVRGLSLRQACATAGVPMASYQGWAAAVAQAGEAGLQTRYAACGRRAKFELSNDEQEELRRFVLIHDSETFAIEQFARVSPVCRHETRAAILAEMDQAAKERRYCRWPVSLRRAARVTAEEKAKLRGEKHFEALSFSPRKGLFFTDAEGNNIPLGPHVAWVMDDYSTNQPYIIGGREDQRLCRQVLAAMDVFSDAWLSVEMIGRERDQYRAEDILRFILRTIDGQGTMPLYLMLERGRWDSAAVHGLDLGRELGAKYAGRKWGALDDLFGIIHGFSSRHKACLESSFNMLQRALAHTGLDIGRSRGEFEKATKALLAVQAQAKLIENGGTPRHEPDAQAMGFLTQEQAMEWHWKAMQQLNGRGKHRAATGTVDVPDDLLSFWDEADARKLPESERWRFLPVKRMATVRGGFIETSVAPYPKAFRFQVNGLVDGPNLPSGYNVLVAFDPATPAMRAYVCNGEAEAANREGWGVGEFLVTAPNAEDAPQFDLRTGGYAGSGKRRAATRASTEFKAINPLGRQGLAVRQRHDGVGNATVQRRGATHPTAGMTGPGHRPRPPPLSLSARLPWMRPKPICPDLRGATSHPLPPTAAPKSPGWRRWRGLIWHRCDGGGARSPQKEITNKPNELR